MCVSLLLPLLMSTLLGGPAAGEPAHGASGDRPARHARVLRVQPNDPLTRDNLTRLQARSRTARDVLERIEALKDAVVIVRAHPLLLRESRLYGRGRFWVVNGRLFGLLEYQAEPRGSARALRVLAHELGHALEVGLAPRGRDTHALREVLLAREDAETDEVSAAGVETEFARAVGYRVHLELTGRLRQGEGPGVPELAARLHLPSMARDGASGPRLQP